MKKNVLLTGASGTVGSEVLRILSNRDDIHLTVFDLKNAKTDKIFKPYLKKIELVYGNLTNIADVQRVAKNQDVVIHLAAIIPPLADEKPELAYDVNVNGTKKLIQALEKFSPDSFFMYSSSISVYGDRIENPDIYVNDPIQPSICDHYAETKVLAEKIIRESALKWTIFRLCAIMGNHKISKLMFHMPLDTTMEICTPEDTAAAFVNGIEKKETLCGKVFNLGGGKKCATTFQNFLQQSFNLYGLGKLNFDENSFATHNFHCGYYADGDELETILHFRKDDLDTYFEKSKEHISPAIKFFGKIFGNLVKKYLESQSEPLRALRKGNTPLVERFFVKKTGVPV